MKNPLFINNTGSIQDKVDALINVVNVLTNQMYHGRVKQAMEDIETNKQNAETELLELSATIVDLEYERLMEVINNV